MSLKEKYSKLIELANNSHVQNLSVEERGNVLYLSGTTSTEVKDKLWELYNQLDPDMRAGDLKMNFQISNGNGNSNQNQGLEDKYRKLLDFAEKSNVYNLSVEQKNNILYISGTANSKVKDKLWEIYGEIDKDMRAGDLMMNINIDDTLPGFETYEIQSGDSLSRIAMKYPDMTWQKIYEMNKDVIKDPNKIFPGQKIIIPTKK